MEYELLKKLTVSHINKTITLMEKPGDFTPSDLSYLQVIEEEIFVTLSFIGALIERADSSIKNYPETQAIKYLWNYSKHGESVFEYVKLTKQPDFSFPLQIGDNNFTFSSGFYAWSEMPFDKGNTSKKQYAAFQNLYQGQHIPNTLRKYLEILSRY